LRCFVSPLAGASEAASVSALLFCWGRPMQQPPPRLSWSEIIVLGLLAFGLLLGLGANSRSLLDSLTALGFLAFIFLAAWLQQKTLENARLTGKQRLLIAAVLIPLALFLAFLVWWS